MEVAVLTDELELEIQDREKPSVGPKDVLVAVHEVGICGSDVHFYEHGRIGESVVTDPLVLGHESAGEIIELGSDVEGLDIGDRVALEPGIPCRHCQHCKRGEYHLCPDVRFMAAPPIDGALAEYTAWPADFVYKLPEEVSTREGALCEPLSVGIHACQRGDVGIGDTVLITGAGPIGLLALEAARAAGASPVIISDVVDEKLTAARQRGASHTINVSESDLGEAVAKVTDADGADVVIEASGAQPAVKDVTSVTACGGVVVLVGMTDEPRVSMDTHALIRNEIDVRGSFRYANTYPTAIELLANDAIDVEGIVDFEYPFPDVDSAFRHALKPTAVKGMITLTE